MIIHKKLFSSFNTPKVTLVISGYPEAKSNGETTHGIAWYTKKTLEAQSKQFGLRFVVLAEKGKDNKPRLVCDDKILILRIFDKKHPSLFPQILTWLHTFSKIKKVLVHSEFCADGGPRNFLLLLPFLALIKFSGKQITYFSHNVVENFDQIAPHLNLKRGSLKLKFFNLGIKVYNIGLGLIVDTVVVLDRVLQERITKFINPAKVIYTPIWVEHADKPVGKEKARDVLGIAQDEHIILYFGFVSWYKGADWLIKSFVHYIAQHNNKKVRLIIAGGPAYSLKEKVYYKKFYAKLEQIAATHPQVTITGFVKDSHIPLYFQAADLAVYPYRGLIGASGGLNHALQYHKPFMVSNLMQKALGDMVSKELTFGHTDKGMAEIIDTVKDDALLAKLVVFSKQLAHKLSMSESVQNEYNGIYASTRTTTYHQKASVSLEKLELKLAK